MKRYSLAVLVTAAVSCEVFAVVTEPNRVVSGPAGFAEIVTVVAARLTGWVACQNVPLTGTVPLILAVTEPI